MSNFVTRWIVTGDEAGPFTPVEIRLRETEKLFWLEAKNQVFGHDVWPAVSRRFRWSSKVSKNDVRLFESREAAIKDKIEQLQASHEKYTRRVVQIVDEIDQLESLLVD